MPQYLTSQRCSLQTLFVLNFLFLEEGELRARKQNYWTLCFSLINRSNNRFKVRIPGKAILRNKENSVPTKGRVSGMCRFLLKSPVSSVLAFEKKGACFLFFCQSAKAFLTTAEQRVWPCRKPCLHQQLLLFQQQLLLHYWHARSRIYPWQRARSALL